MDNETARLARRVAEAADAWLSDPRDTQTYGRLVDATLTWRACAQPMLDGTAHVGRRTPMLDGLDLLDGIGGIGAPDVRRRAAATRPDPDADPEPDPEPLAGTGSRAERAPQRLDFLLGAVADELRLRTTHPTD